jgi:5-methylcytosine-specific restriction endonuclease McrA
MNRDNKTKPFPISNIEHLINKNRINFDPVYQRGFVWKKPQKELFIDSLLLGYDIPKIYFHDNPNNNFKYDVVDGQQRLLTINEFLKGKFKLPQESDPIDGEVIAEKYYEELSDDLQMEIKTISLDVVILNSGYSQDDIEDMFLRYQNGEPLNAAEKRKAIPGKFKEIVKDLGNHVIFEICGFNNNRDGYQDAAAKMLHVRFNGSFTSITPAAIKKTYLNNSKVTSSNPHYKEITKALNFLNSGFKKSVNPNPKIKKFAILTYTELANFILENYTANNYKKEIANALLRFETERTANSELDEENQNSLFNNFTDAARGDSPAQQEYRFNTLLTYLLQEVPELETKDPQRDFTNEQRQAIYFNNEGICQICNTKVEPKNFHADHIVAHSKGGVTKVSNGQVTCMTCNLTKSSK